MTGLLAEPYRTSRITFSLILPKKVGGEIKVVESAEEAEELLESPNTRFDYFVCHLHFQDEEGRRDYDAAKDLCVRARDVARRNQWGRLPIVLLTGSNAGPQVAVEKGFPTEDVHVLDTDFGNVEEMYKFLKSRLPDVTNP